MKGFVGKLIFPHNLLVGQARYRLYRGPKIFIIILSLRTVTFINR